MRKILFAIVFACSLDAEAQLFSTPVVMESMNSSGGNAGSYNSQVVVNGNSAIAYYDLWHGDLMFVRAIDAAGSAWATPIVVDHINDVGRYCSMKIIQGFPAITYIDFTYNRLKYVRALDANGSSWGTPVVVDALPNQFPAMPSLDVINGNPAIAYGEYNNYDLKYVRASDAFGTSWDTPQFIATTGMVGGEPKLFVTNGNPSVVYGNQTTGEVLYQRALDVDGLNWGSVLTISGPGDAGYEMSVAFANGNPVVSYFDNTTTNLKFVASTNINGSAWGSPVILDNNANTGRYTSMIHSGNYLMIVYQDQNNNRTKFIRSTDATGNSWNSPIPINAAGHGSCRPSIEIVNGVPAVSLCNELLRDTLKFIAANDAGGNSWSAAYVFRHPRTSGQFLSMCVVDGRPAVVSSGAGPNRILFNIAGNSAGTTWDTTHIVSVATAPAAYVSMQLIGNNPAICYSGSGSDRLSYIRSLDSIGGTWATPKRVDSTTSGHNCQLLDLNGTPAIAYWDNINASIRFTHALNGNGTSWSPSIAPFINDSIWFDVAVINGRPAIAYIKSNPTNNAIMFSIANDSMGTTWSVPIPVLTINLFDSPPSLENVGGYPAVVYREPNTYTVGYIRALDSLGSTWALPMQPDLNGYTGGDPTLLFHDGRPVISFTGSYNERCFITAYDRIGSAWYTTVFVDSIYAPSTVSTSDAISLNGNVGIGYYQPSDKYGYYSSACVAPLNPLITSNNTLCSGNSANLQTQGYGTLSWYTSSTGGTYLGSGNTFTTPPLTNTTTYYVQDSTCAASPRTAVTVTVNPLPAISLSGNTSYCSGDSTTLSVSGNGDGFEWSTGSTMITEFFSPTTTTNYWVNTYDGSGCTDTIFFSINVTQPQTTSQTVNLCAGDWYTVGNNTYTNSGTYTDSLTTVQLGCDSVVVTTITIQPAVDTTLSYAGGILTSNESGAAYQWINCTTQQLINGATNQSYTPTQNGTYAAIIVNGPCTDTSSCYTVADVGMGEYNSGAAVLTVTVSLGEITASLQHVTGPISFEYYNALGELVYSVSGKEGEPAKYRTQAAGMYVIKAMFAGTTIVKRVVTQ